ncbi:MAG: response regulator transcription factor [Rhizobacter sp.]|nr:response regulator transcription factor [Ferruginibacter sp.]
MEKLECIIVEDEPLAAELLADYISQVPFLELNAIYSDAIYAMDGLKSKGADVVFLDINLPKLKGYDFIKILAHPPQVIITTAYRDYAVDGYELNVTDYLLKPVNFNRFLMAVNKLKKKEPLAEPASATVSPERKSLTVNISKKRVKVFLDEILFIESQREYIHIITGTTKYVVKMQLTEMEAQLDTEDFVRVHRSFIVAIKKITAYNASQVEIGEQVIPIGRSYKEPVLKCLAR